MQIGSSHNEPISPKFLKFSKNISKNPQEWLKKSSKSKFSISLHVSRRYIRSEPCLTCPLSLEVVHFRFASRPPTVHSSSSPPSPSRAKCSRSPIRRRPQKKAGPPWVSPAPAETASASGATCSNLKRSTRYGSGRHGTFCLLTMIYILYRLNSVMNKLFLDKSMIFLLQHVAEWMLWYTGEGGAQIVLELLISFKSLFDYQ